MILAIDIGNTTVTLGGVRIAPQQAYSLEFTARMNLRSSSFLKTRIFPRPTFGASSFPALFRRF
mgnify:CR=1 FL=1